MGNARSKSASRPRLSEKQQYLFQQSGKHSHEYPSFSPKPSFSQKKIPTTPTIITETSKIHNKDRKVMQELNQSLKTCSEIMETNSMFVPNSLFLQYSSLLYNPEKLNNRREGVLVFDFFGNSEKTMKVLKTPRDSKKHRDLSELPKSNGDLSNDLKKVVGSFIRETPKGHNTRDLSSPKEDGSTPHFDKKSDFSQNSQTKLEIAIPTDVEKAPLNGTRDFTHNIPKENPVSLKEKLSHILKSNLNKSMNSDNSLKFSGILEALDEEPHHIHLNLEDFLKGGGGGGENDRNSSNNTNILSRANLEKLNSINNKSSYEKRNVVKNSSLPKKSKNTNQNINNVNNSKRNIITNGLNNSKSGNLKEGGDNTMLSRNKFLQNMAISMMKNKENEGNNKKPTSVNKFSNENNNLLKTKRKN